MRAYFLVKNTNDASAAFELRELPIPTPGPGQVCVKAEAFGLNFADVMARQGLYEECPKLPCVIGYEVVGRVHAVGEGVANIAVGQRVTALTRFGGYAEYALTDQRAVAIIPEEMSVGVAVALATQGATAWQCAEESVRLHAGDHVLVQAAAGGVGTLLVQMAKNKGCIVYGTAGSAAKLAYLKKLGVDHAINYNEQDFEDAVRKINGSRGLDVVFDSVGGKSVSKGMKLLGAGGRMVMYGVAAMSGSKNIFRILGVVGGFGLMSPIPLLQKAKSMLGVNMLQIADNRPESLQRSMAGVVDLVAKGQLKPEIGGVFKHTELAKAHELLGNRGTMGKLVCTWNN